MSAPSDIQQLAKVDKGSDQPYDTDRQPAAMPAIPCDLQSPSNHHQGDLDTSTQAVAAQVNASRQAHVICCHLEITSWAVNWTHVHVHTY